MGWGGVMQARDVGCNLTNIQCKAIQNWHDKSPLYNENMQIK
jgi:hypothetical protein